MRLRSLCSALILAAALPTAVVAVEDAAPTKEYLQQKAEIEEMLTKRDLDLFEFQFNPVKMDRIVITDRRGVDHVFNYLLFTIRNHATLDQAQMATRAKGYNEVLQSLARQFENAKVDAEGGVKLKVDGMEGKDGVVLERSESKPRTRTVSLTALAYDEHGTRIRLLDDPQELRLNSERAGVRMRDAADPPSDRIAQFAFSDLGTSEPGSVSRLVKEKIEEHESRKLLTVDEIGKLSLPPFDGVTRVNTPNIEDPAHDMNGWYVGEAHGVILFDRLSDYGTRFTVQIHGLCNAFRFRSPPAEPGKPENYFQAKVLRRTMVLEYSRPGHEFDRNLDQFTLVNSGYKWVDSFQRTDTRRTSAYVRYFIDNISDDKGQVNAEVAQKFWQYYEAERATHDKLPDLKAGQPTQ